MNHSSRAQETVSFSWSQNVEFKFRFRSREIKESQCHNKVGFQVLVGPSASQIEVPMQVQAQSLLNKRF